MTPDPELITIVEGPPPEFRPTEDAWAFSLLDSARPFMVSICQVRSFKGQALQERCQRAWAGQRPIRLDFPTMSGLRKQLEIISARYEKLPEGDLLNLWVRHMPHEIEDPRAREDDEPPEDSEA
jgi:hypothetical protein